MATEIDQLDPIPELVVLRSGLRVRLESLRTRQFLKLLRILTHGALPGLRESGLFDSDASGDEFLGRMLSITLLSIPDAEDETITFVKSMCYPDGLIERGNLNKQDSERNTILWEGLEAELDNPELDDLVTIMEAIVRREASDIQALGKRLASMMKLAQKVGELPSPSPKASTSESSEDSAERSTSSRRSTAGRTKRSTTSRSVESVNASLLSENDSITPVGSVSIG